MIKGQKTIFLGILILFSVFAAGCKKKETVKLYTDEATQITGNSAVVSGEVKSDVLLNELGVCYGTTSNPTTNDKTKTVNSDMTSFKCQLNNLQEKQTYYARAYAITSKGYTYYGNDVSFETSSIDGLIGIYQGNLSIPDSSPVTLELSKSSTNTVNLSLPEIETEAIRIPAQVIHDIEVQIDDNGRFVILEKKVPCTVYTNIGGFTLNIGSILSTEGFMEEDVLNLNFLITTEEYFDSSLSFLFTGTKKQ